MIRYLASWQRFERPNRPGEPRHPPAARIAGPDVPVLRPALSYAPY